MEGAAQILVVVSHAHPGVPHCPQGSGRDPSSHPNNRDCLSHPLLLPLPLSHLSRVDEKAAKQLHTTC